MFIHNFASRIMVPCTAVVRLNLVVYAGMVDPLVLLVFCYRQSVLLFLRTLAWRGAILVLYIPNQM